MGRDTEQSITVVPQCGARTSSCPLCHCCCLFVHTQSVRSTLFCQMEDRSFILIIVLNLGVFAVGWVHLCTFCLG